MKDSPISSEKIVLVVLMFCGVKSLAGVNANEMPGKAGKFRIQILLN
jgi:hypothetical protein